MKKYFVFLLFSLIAAPLFLQSQTKNREKEKAPEKYQILGWEFYKNYCFEQAAECFAKSGDSISKERAITAAQMLQRVENVEFIDSIVVPANEILQYFPKNEEIGFAFCDSINKSLFGFLAGKKDRKIFAVEKNNNTDLYQSDCFLDGWSSPALLSNNLNTDKDENFPFVLADGITIFFASKGHNSIGGYDIFMSRSNSAGEYLLPQNIGMPFNSPANDYLMVIDENKKLGWFASDRNLPAGKTAIYTFIYNSEKNILKNLSSEELRSAAQIVLSTRHKMQGTGFDRQDMKIKNRKIEKNFAFVLTDTLVYHKFSDFKSAAALEKFRFLQQKDVETSAVETELDALRTKYFYAAEAEKNLLSEKIILLEKQLITLKKTLKNLANEVRNLELF
ncbi:MAG: hypothetical protein LBB53_00360 [Prevotellaceae bacterium]|nr:hypothetical protein [Prevotellaceae bacterium]